MVATITVKSAILRSIWFTLCITFAMSVQHSSLPIADRIWRSSTDAGYLFITGSMWWLFAVASHGGGMKDVPVVPQQEP